MATQEIQRGGTTNYGLKYESHISALIALRCYFDEDIESFWILTNAKDYVEFDDIVLHITRKQSSSMFVIQLKHKENADVTYNHLCKTSGDFGIKKYEKNYEKIMRICNERYAVDDVKFILYTSASYNHNYYQKLLKIHTDSQLDDNALLNTSPNCLSPFKLEFSDSDYNDNFLKKLYLFTEQAHANKVETLITDLVTSKISKHIDSNVTTILLKYFDDWILFKDLGYCKFDMAETEMKSLEIIVKPYVQLLDMGQHISDDTAAYDMWNRVALVHDVIFLPYNRDFLIQIAAATKWKIQMSEAWSLFKENKLLEHDKYKGIILRRKKHLREPELEDLYFALWELNEIPLILYCQNPQDYEIVIGALTTFNKNIKKFIIFSHQEETEDLKGYKVFKNLKESNYILEGAKISLQGRKSMEQPQLSRNEEIPPLITPDIFLQMSYGKLEIGNGVATEEYLVDRFFRRMFVKLEILLEMSEEFIVFSGSLDLAFLFDITQRTFQRKLAKIVVVITCQPLETISLQSIEEITKNYSSGDKPLHFLSWKPGLYNGKIFPFCEWWYSTKNAKVISKYLSKLDEAKSICIQANRSLGYYNTPLVICNNAGMGKTVTLKYLSSVCPPDTWVVFIEIPKYINHLLEINTDARSILEILEPFLYSPQDKAEVKKFVSTLFKTKLEENQVVFFLDDYDEFCRGRIDHFLQVLRSHTDRILITTRPPSRTHLEETLNTVATELIGFDVNTQREFLKKSLDEKEIVYDPEKLNETLETIKSSFNTFANEIMRIPLQIKMIAGILSEDSLDYFIENKLSVMDLYEKFISLKMKRNTDIYAVRKIAVDFCYEGEFLRKLINRNELEAYKRDHDNSFRSYIFEGCDHNGDPRFVHPSFAEYLTAAYLEAHLILLDHEPYQHLLRKNLDVGFFSIRNFFDMMLSKHHPLHEAVLSDDLSQVEGLMKNSDIQTMLQDTDGCGRTVLHLAASYGHFFLMASSSLPSTNMITSPEGNTYIPTVITTRCNGEKIFSLLVEKILGIQDTQNPIYEKDKLGLTVYDYAYLSGCLKNIQILKTAVPIMPLNIPQSDHDVYLYQCLRHGLNNLLLDLDFSCLCHLKCNDEYLVNTAVKHCSLDVIRKVLENLGSCHSSEEDKPSRSFLINQRDLLNSACEREGEATETVEIIRLLVKQGASVIWSGSQQRSPLHTAAIRGNPKVVQALLAIRSISVNAVDNFKRSALHIAAQRGHAQCAIQLIKKKAKVNLADRDGNSALHLSVLSNSVECAMELIKHGADVNKPNNKGDTPLICAARYGSKELLALLLDNQADISKPNNEKKTPLMCAIEGTRSSYSIRLPNSDSVTMNICLELPKENVMNCIKELLNRGEDIKKPDKDGNSMLMLAVRSRQRQIVDDLLEMGVDFRKFNRHGSSVLTYAIEIQSDDYVKKFLEMGVPVDGKDAENNTHLMLAFKWGSEPTISLLLQKNCSVTGKNIEGLTPLAMLVGRDFSVDYISQMLAKGAELDEVDKFGHTPLMIAIKFGRVGYATTLLGNGASVTIQNEHGASALTLAIEADLEELSIDIVSKIFDRENSVASRLRHKALLNEPTIDGNTPLMLAVKKNMKSLVNELMKRDGSPEKRNRNAAWELAVKDNNADIVEMLKKFNCNR